MFGKLGKPKWQHSDPDVRTRAVSALNPSLSDDHERLFQIAQQDADSSVRLVAITRLHRFPALKQIWDRAATSTEKHAAYSRLVSVISDTTDASEQNRREFLDFLMSANLSLDELADITLKVSDARVAIELVDRMKDEPLLVKVALAGKAVKTRIYAAEKLISQESLKCLQKESTDKAVSQYAREKLKSWKEQEKFQQEQDANAEKLCVSLEKLAALEFDRFYEERLQALLAHWSELDAEARGKHALRWESALSRCRTNSDGIKVQHEKQNQTQAFLHQLKQICVELDASEKKLRADASAYDAASFSEFLEVQQANWKQATESELADSGRAAAYHQYMELLKGYQSARERLFEMTGELGRLLDRAASEAGLQDIKSVKRDLLKTEQQVHWPEGFEKPEVLLAVTQAVDSLAEKLRQVEEDARAKSQFIGKKITVLQKEIEKRNLLAANRLYHFIARQTEELSEPYRQQEKARLQKVDQSLAELRDWCEFVTMPKKEELCQKMETLIGSSLPPIELAHQVKQLQAAWRELTSSNNEAAQALWLRFKAAADEAYKPCLAYYEGKDLVRTQNLRKKMEICDQLTQFIESTDWAAVDWRKVELIDRTARSEWELYKDVPQSERESIYGRFESLMGQILSRLNAERDDNLARRVELIARAEALLALDSLDDVVAQIQRLQDEWKKAGLTYRSQDNKQWKRFKATCDRIFEKRTQLKTEAQQKNQQIADQLNQLIGEVRQLVELEDDVLVESKNRYADLKRQFEEQASVLPAKLGKPLEKSFDQAGQSYRQKLDGLAGRKQYRQLQSFAKAMQACIELESAVFDEEGAANIGLLQQRFKELCADIPDKHRAGIQARFEETVNAFAAGTVQAYRQQAAERQKKLEELAIELEIRTDIASPEAHRATRMQYQLVRLQSRMREAPQEPAVLLAAWYRVGAIEPSARRELEDRFQKVVEILSNGVRR